MARLDFSNFDSRGYRTVDVRRGYAEWAPTYEQTVQDAMDVALLESLTQVPWTAVAPALDLGCGTGRTGAWLRRHGVAVVDGIDLTPEMLATARATGVYRHLAVADVAETGVESEAYGLVTTCLVDEHLPRLQPLYEEAWRLVRPGGLHVLVGYHPHFIMAAGMPTHFNRDSGEPLAIETHVHLLSDHVAAALEVGFALVEMRERLIDEEWLVLKPKWARFKGHPIAFACVWRKPGRGPA